MLIFIGATTENPSFELNNALVYKPGYLLKALNDTDISQLVQQALLDTERGLGARHLQLEEDAMSTLVRFADGDGRRALNTLIAADLSQDSLISASQIQEILRTVVVVTMRR